MSRTHIRITDGPIYGAPVVARGYDERRYRESYEASSRRQNYDRTDGRGYRAGPVYRGFEEFDTPRYYYREPPRRTYWSDDRGRRVYRDEW